MTKILLIGHNPPPMVRDVKIEASHYRTWQFLVPLIEDGHTISLCADNIDLHTDAHSIIPETWKEQLEYHPIPFGRQRGWTKRLQQIHDSFRPDCIIAVNFDCCQYATKLKTNKPIWMDIYGDYLTILQVARFRQKTDRGIPTSISFMRRVLQKGDVFSGCSIPQQHMFVGELAMVGRLNSRSFGYQFSHVILPGSPPGKNEVMNQRENDILKMLNIPHGSFVVLWCGGYNTWTDVDTLFAGLEWAMSRNDHIHYISVGENTYQAPDNIYTRFLNLIAQSNYQDRFHMLGWRPWAEIDNYYHASNLGINIDSLHYETIYGTRTRLVEMLAAGLPAITSLGCELSQLIEKHGAGLTFESEDWKSMGDQILSLASDNTLYTKVARNASSYANNELSFYSTTAPVRDWSRKPSKAPDKGYPNLSFRIKRLEFQTRSILRQLLWVFFSINK